MTESDKMLWDGIREKNFDKARIALNLGADVHLKNGGMGWTPLHLAIITQAVEIVALLVLNGATSTIKDSRGKVAMDYLDQKEDKELISDIQIAITKLFIHKLTYEGLV